MSDTPQTDEIATVDNEFGKGVLTVVPIDFARKLERQRDELVRALTGAQDRLGRVKTKGRGNDFFAAIVAVEQDLRAALASVKGE